MTIKNSTHYPTIANIVEWFNRAKPVVQLKDIGIQMGVHFEEVSEMVENLSAISTSQNRKIHTAFNALQDLADDMKVNPEDYYVAEDARIEMLDALCDQIVTATGTGVFLGMNIEAAVQHVDDSNWSKFVNDQAVFTEQGKIAKGPDYFKPDLAKYV